jgi:excisionase family DNA binding protein
VVLDDDPRALAQLGAALEAYARQLRRNGGYLAPDLLALMRSVEARNGQERPKFARLDDSPHSRVQPAEGAGASLAAIGLTYVQAAERLGVSERTVRRRVADGELPVVRLGARTCRVPLAAITELVREEPAR